MINQLDSLRKDLNNRYDYSTYSCFKALDRDGDGKVDSYELSVFLKNNGRYLNERELMNIIRRIDSNGDATLNFNELCEMLNVSSASSLGGSYINN